MHLDPDIGGTYFVDLQNFSHSDSIDTILETTWLGYCPNGTGGDYYIYANGEVTYYPKAG